jgi:two-component system, NtrC family, response regulator AtoC
MSPTRDSSFKPTLLLVDDDREFARMVGLRLRDVFDVETVHDGDAALAAVAGAVFDAIVLDAELEREPDGLEVLRRIRTNDPQVPILMVTRSETTEMALKAGRLGATDYFTKGSPIESLTHRIVSALQVRMAERQQEAIARDAGAPTWIFVGESEPVRRLLEDALTVAASESRTLLITGEHGTGKETLARYIHHHSRRAERPFIAVNCPAIPAGLVESELFGHEKGAYTHATGIRRGSFELVGEGTLLLDEITEMPLGLQPKLLRALQDGEFSRLGSERVQRSRARVICTTNRDPLEAVHDGRLREDLYYRVNVVRLHIPPLRDRFEDVQALAKHFLLVKNRELGKRLEGFTPEAEALLLAHDWPGNARELENLVERAAVFCREPRIGADLLSPISEGAAFLALPWEQAKELAMRRFERSYLTALLQVYSGSIAHAARAMGVSRQAFYKALDRAGGLSAERFRRSRSTPPDAS